MHPDLTLLYLHYAVIFPEESATECVCATRHPEPEVASSASAIHVYLYTVQPRLSYEV